MASAAATAAVAVAFVPATAVAGNDVPVDFRWEPAAPIAGQPATLTAASFDGPIVTAVWDLDGDTRVDAVGATVTTTFPAPGPRLVSARVVIEGGDTGTASHTIAVAPPPPPPVAAIAAPAPAPGLMAPFPLVRMQGRLVSGGVLVTRLTVHAPTGARVHVACANRGHGCPTRPTDAISRSRRGVRARRFERRLGAGAIVQVSVTDGRSIGKYTSFRVRSRGAPLRRDLCISPAVPAPARCPGS